MIRQLEEKLRTAPDTSELQKRRDLLRQQAAAIQERRVESGGLLRKSMAGAFTTIAASAVSEFRAGLGSLKEKGEIPGQISEQLITELLEHGQCICGRHISEEGDVRERLLKELDRAQRMAPLRSSLLDIHARLGSVRALADSKCREAQRGYQGYLEETENLADVNSALEGISLELEDVEEIDRQAWERERAQKQHDLSTAMANVRSLEQQLKQDAAELKELERRLAEVAEKTRVAAELRRKAAWAEAASDALKAIVHEFATLARLDVERRTAALWHRLLPNTRQYEVEVTDGFELSVDSPTGAAGLSQLSMGQQHCLGLAFITSVAQASETLPPLVIDMPFGRLDSEVAATVATEMPSLTNQLVLFVLEGTEWNEQTRRALEPALARVARLRVDPATKNTHIRIQE